MNVLQSMPMRSRLMLAGSVLAVVVIAFVLFRLASAPSYSLVATGLDPAKTGKMTTTLDAQGIGYQLRNNGTALAVESGSTAKAQVALAGAGLSGGSTQPGFELLDQQKMGSSSFQQQVAYQRALEGQIAQTLGQVSGVSGAQVQLTLPQDQLFASDEKPATAAVLLSGDASTLAPGAVRGMANLVSNSVQGLKPANVTITDDNGQMLWPTADAAAGVASKPQAEARYANDLEAQVNAMLTRTLGPGKAQVQVSADLNVDQTSLDKLTYAKKGVPMEVSKDTETLKGGAGAGGGAAAGTAANIPGYAQTGAAAGAGGTSNYKHKVGTTKYGVSKTIAHTKVAPGSVNRLGVALMVDKTVPAAQVAQLRKAVANAVGLQTTRGDTLSVSQLAFAKPPAAATGLVPAGGIMGYAKYVLLGLASLLFLFFVARHLRRRENEALVEPTWLRQLEAPTPIAQLQDTQVHGLPPASSRHAEIEQTVQREPERVATALRGWMAEDE
jgi:flagellar M-ring protein FliF